MKPSLAIILSALAFSTFLVWGFHYDDVDLWWDELISLTEYSLVDFETTVTKYLDPNNHILFNLMNNLLTRIWGERDVYRIMDHVAPLRWIQWLFALGTLIYVFLTGRRLFGPVAGGLAALFLVSCLPFLNFAMQLRGYNLSMFFVAGLVFHCGVGGLRNRSLAHLIMTAVYSFGLLYTVPSNVYFLITLSAFLLWQVTRYARARGGAVFRYLAFWLLAAIGLGTLLAFLAYTPVLESVTGNRFVTNHPPDRGFILLKRLPQVLNHLMSYRYLLLLIVLPGLYGAIRHRSLGGRGRVLPLLILLLLPFVLSFVRNDYAFQRTFIHLAPVFALLLAAGISLAVEARGRSSFASKWLPFIAGLYALSTLPLAHIHIQKRLRDNLIKSIREQNIFANYYQSREFRLLRLSRALAREHSARPGHVFLANELDRVAWTFYLEKFDIKSYALVRVWEEPYADQGTTYTHVGVFQESPGKNSDLIFYQQRLSLPKLLEGDRFSPVLEFVHAYDPAKRYYLITGFADQITRVLRDRHPRIEAKSLNEGEGFRLFLLTPPE